MSSPSKGSGDTLYIIVGAAAFGFLTALVALAVLACRRKYLLSSNASSTAPAGIAVATAANSASAAGVPEEGVRRSGTGADARKSRASGGGPLHFSSSTGTTPYHSNSNNNNNSSTKAISEIYLGADKDEVSTLGDPVFPQTAGMVAPNNLGAAANPEPDEQTASVENDYDYKKQLMKSQGLGYSGSFERISSDMSLSMQHSSVGQGLGATGYYDLSGFGGGGSNMDDFHNPNNQKPLRIEVSVPPGKLGMVVDTPNGGLPCVHALRSDSILAPQVKVGDRLILVDGDDVTIMTALQVSQLISLKADQTRVLVFLRPPKPARNNSNSNINNPNNNDQQNNGSFPPQLSSQPQTVLASGTTTVTDGGEIDEEMPPHQSHNT